MSRRRNPGEDPFATRAERRRSKPWTSNYIDTPEGKAAWEADVAGGKVAAPRGGKMTKGDKLFLGGALLAGILGVIAWKKGNLWSPYRAPSAPSPTPRAPSSGGSSVPRYTPAVPAAASSDASSESAPVDPSQLTASFGDTPAVPAGGYYDSPPGG